MTQQTTSKANHNQRWVIKIGSALLTNDGQGLNEPAIKDWVKQIAQLRNQGVEVILVSSGSVAEGMVRLGWQTRPDSLHQLQAAAAVGQMGLIRTYEQSFERHGVTSAQVLLTHDDLKNRKRYLNARQTLRALVDLNVVAIINENDTVATEEIRFGDNDTLAGLVANLVDADMLLILTDQDGLFDADPRKNPDAKLVSQAQANDEKLDDYAKGSGGVLGRGGMATKLRSARLAARSGTDTMIANGREPDILMKLLNGETFGSRLLAGQQRLAARKQWILAQNPIGQLTVDAGAEKALRGKKSLLAVGVKQVSGEFERGDSVACVNEDGQEVLRGIVNYNSSELQLLLGKTSKEFAQILGYHGDDELIHKDNMASLA